MCKLKGLTEYQIADNASVSRLQRPRPENVLFQKQRAKKVPLFPTNVTVPKLHIDLVRPKKYRPYLALTRLKPVTPASFNMAKAARDLHRLGRSGRLFRLTMSCGRRQRPPEVAR